MFTPSIRFAVLPDTMRESIVSELSNGQHLTVIARSRRVKRNLVYDRLRDWGVDIGSVRPRPCDESYFEFIDSEAKAYWLGFLMADGCIYIKRTAAKRLQIHLSAIDAQHVELFAQAIRSCRTIHRNHPPSSIGGPEVTLHINSNRLCDDLIKHGCTPRKSLTLRFPVVDQPLRHHLCRGYFDGDGCASRHVQKSGCRHLRLSVLGTPEFLAGFALEASGAMGYLPKATARPGRSPFELNFNGNLRARRFRDWLYMDSTIYLQRKREVCYSSF